MQSWHNLHGMAKTYIVMWFTVLLWEAMQGNPGIWKYKNKSLDFGSECT